MNCVHLSRETLKVLFDFIIADAVNQAPIQWKEKLNQISTVPKTILNECKLN